MWAAIVAFVASISDLVVNMPPFDWGMFMTAVFAVIIAIFRAMTSRGIK